MRIARALAIAAVAALSLAAGKANWTATVNVAPGGQHTLGNPAAKVKLTEYVSYTCPHCASFQRTADAPMRLAYVMPGKLSVSVNHFVRDPVDLTVAMLTHCGDAKSFFRRHHDFMATQDKWLSRMAGTTEAQRQRWRNKDVPTAMRAIASDFGFYEMMARYGTTRAGVDRCLAQTAKADQLIAQTQAAEKAGVEGTPSFALNGIVLAGTHNWETLNPQIAARVE
ncbi:MAG: thioredoxin domain-containing protein [Sphingomonadaceae bacterium]